MRTFAGFKIFFVSFLVIGCTGAFDLDRDKVPAEMIQLETKPDGSGTSISETVQVNLSEELNLHAIYRNQEGQYIKNVEVSWRLVGEIGSLTILSNGTSARYVSLNPGTVTVEVLYQDKIIKSMSIQTMPTPKPSLTWSIVNDTGSVNEGDDFEITFNLSKIYNKDVSFEVSTSDQSANAGNDYIGKSSEVVTIPSGQTQKTISISTISDNFYENLDEQFDVTVSNLVNAITSLSTAEITLVDQDSVPTVSVADASVNESAGSVDVTVSLSHASYQSTSIDYSTVDDVAVSAGGSYLDYTSASGTLSFDPGQTSKTITISISEDTLDEIDETFNLQLTSPVNLSSITDAIASVTIVDNDLSPSMTVSDVSVNEGGLATLTVNLSAISGRQTSFDWNTVDGGASAGTDYTAQTQTTVNIPVYTSSVNITVQTIDDSDYCEVNDTFDINFSNLSGIVDDGIDSTVTIVENDVPDIIITDAPSVTEGTKATYTASLSAACALDVSFEYKTFPLDAKEGHDYNYTSGIASLPSSSPTANIEVQTIDNSLYEGNQQFLLVAVDNVNLQNGNVTNTSIAVTKIIDNDTGLPEPHVADFRLHAGRHSACAVMGDGDVKCWGNKQGVNHFGGYNVGDETGEMGDNLDPLFIGSVAGDGVTPFTFKKIGLGTGHACAIQNDDKIKCWGNNNYAKLGVGLDGWLDWGNELSHLGENFKYVEINATDIPEDIQAGGDMSCALFYPSGSPTDKFVKCWGRPGYVAQGDTGGNTEIGDGQYEVRNLTPISFPSLAGVNPDKISVGYRHSCALMTNGDLYCWGDNTYGELGVNSTENKGDDDTEVGAGFEKVILNGDSVLQVSAGQHHTCAVLSNNRSKCWGWGSNGELGSGNYGWTYRLGDDAGEMEVLNYINVGTTDGTTPRDVKLIKAGSDHTCVILADNNQVKCFGKNTYGQLGVGDTDDRIWGSELGDNLAEVDLGVGLSAKDLYLGANFTCAILSNDQVKCWGRNHQAQLGYEHTNNIGDQAGEVAAASTVDLGTSRSAVAFSGGYSNVGVCVLLDNNQVKCWGSNGYNNFARNDIAFADEPGEMGSNLPSLNIASGVKARQINLDEAKCIISTDGEVYCWGDQYEGALGNGSIDRDYNVGSQIDDLGNFPKVLTPTGLKALQLVSAERTTCVLFDDFSVRCWGDSTNGKVGIGISTGQNVQYSSQMGDNLTAINFGTGLYPISITSSINGFCALLNNQSVKCWGSNAYGKLGIESSSSYIGHNSADLGDNWDAVNFGTVGFTSGVAKPKKIVGARDSYCALFENQKVKCWGRNENGQLGYGDESSRGGAAGSMGDNLGFVSLGSGVNDLIKDIYAAVEDSRYCGITVGNEVKCWGSDGNIGLLGLGYSTSTDRGDAAGEMGDNLLPAKTGTTNVQSVYSNYDATCALYVNGQMKCWTAINNWGIGGQGHDDPLHESANIGDNMPFIDLE